MDGFIDSFQIGLSGLLLGLLIGLQLSESDAMYLWITVGLVANVLIKSARTIAQLRRRTT